MRHFGHANPGRIERPDSVNDPLLTTWERIVLFAGIGGAGFFGLMVAHGYYVWFLK